MKLSALLKSRKTAAVLAPLVAALVVTGAYIGVNVWRHNFRTVQPGRLFRSAQLSGEQFKDAVRDHGIKTVINLRGVNDQDWYQSETNAAHDLGIAHYDFPLSASQEVSNDIMEKIIAVMNSAPKPILLHCKNGADRSGLFSALYLYSIEGEPAATADHQLSILCFHFPHLFWRDTIAMDHSFWRYVETHDNTLKAAGSNGLSNAKAEAPALAAQRAEH